MSAISAERPAAPGHRHGRRPAGVVRAGLAALVAVSLVVLAVRHRETVATGSDRLGDADPLWLAAAAGGTVLLWTAGTVRQLGAIPARVPVVQLFAVQVAATFVNHVLPSGLGGMAVNARYLSRQGIPPAAAAGAVGLALAAGAVIHTALLVPAVLLVPASAPVVPVERLPGAVAAQARDGWLPAAGVAVAVLAVLAARRFLPALRARLAGAATRTRA